MVGWPGAKGARRATGPAAETAKNAGVHGVLDDASSDSRRLTGNITPLYFSNWDASRASSAIPIP